VTAQVKVNSKVKVQQSSLYDPTARSKEDLKAARNSAEYQKPVKTHLCRQRPKPVGSYLQSLS
jgi:hypothetical protein